MDLKFIVREPENITSQTQMLVMLHGYGSNEEDLFSFRHDLPEDWIIVSLRAPNNSDYEGFSWYDIDFNNAEKFRISGIPIYWVSLFADIRRR